MLSHMQGEAEVQVETECWQRFNHMSALVSNYKEFVDKGISQKTGWAQRKLVVSISDLISCEPANVLFAVPVDFS